MLQPWWGNDGVNQPPKPCGEALDPLLADNRELSLVNTSQSLAQMPFLTTDSQDLPCLTSESEANQIEFQWRLPKKQFRFSHSKFLRLAKALWQVPFNFCGKVHHRSWGDGTHGYSHPSPSSRLVQWKCFLIWESMNLKKCSWFEVKLFLIVRYSSLIRHAMACACMRIWGVTQLGWERYAYALSASINLCGFGCNCPWSTCHVTHADVAQKRSTRACVARDTCMLLFETGWDVCMLLNDMALERNLWYVSVSNEVFLNGSSHDKKTIMIPWILKKCALELLIHIGHRSVNSQCNQNLYVPIIDAPVCSHRNHKT